MRARAGFTLVEVTFALAILGLVCLTVFSILSRVQTYEAHMMALSDLHAQTRAALDMVSRMVREAKVGTVVPAVGKPLCSSYIQFSRPVAVPVTSTPIAYETVEIRLLPAVGETDGNGIDDNHDGFVDEGNLVIVLPDGRTIILAANVPRLSPFDAMASNTAIGESFDDNNGVDDDGDGRRNEGNGVPNEPGAWFAWDAAARSVSIGLTLQRRLKTGEVIYWSEDTTVFLRNKESTP